LKAGNPLDDQWAIIPISDTQNIEAVSNLPLTFPNTKNLRVIKWSGENHYFDGDVIGLYYGKAPLNSIAHLIKDGPDDDIEAEALKPAPEGWTIISGGQQLLYPNVSPRYVHFTAKSFENNLYFLASPTNGDEKPSYILVKPRTPNGFSSVCTFNTVEEHF
jgi:hypothetical protein